MTQIIPSASVVIQDLDRMWADSPPTDFRGGKAIQFMESKHDQPTVGENPYWEIVRRMPLDRLAHYETAVDGYGCRYGNSYIVSRKELAKTYAWAIPSPGDIAWLKSVLNSRGVVEIGAGTGYWAWQLSQAEVDVLAIDIEPLGNLWCGPTQYHPVTQGGPDRAAEFSHRALMLCWPPYESTMATEALRAYNGDTLIYIGESQGGCTADDTFFELLESDWKHKGDSPSHVTFGGIHCHLAVYQRLSSKDGAS